MTAKSCAMMAFALQPFGRSATEQALENLAQALRALELAPVTGSDLCPHPLVVVRAEIENARRFLRDADARSHGPGRAGSGQRESGARRRA